MDDGHRATGGDESAAVQAFILEQQRSVLVSARAQIAGCEPGELRREAHRLRGTLGTYQMTDAVTAMTVLEMAAGADASDADLEAARAEALTALHAIGPDVVGERGHA